MTGWCFNRGFFAALVERLGVRHRVITLDWRGHGDSSRSAADFCHEELAADAMAVIETSGVRRIVPVAQVACRSKFLLILLIHDSIANRQPRIDNVAL